MTFDVEKQGGTVVPSSVTWYEIAVLGIDHKIDGESEWVVGGLHNGSLR